METVKQNPSRFVMIMGKNMQWRILQYSKSGLGRKSANLGVQKIFYKNQSYSNSKKIKETYCEIAANSEMTRLHCLLLLRGQARFVLLDE